MMSSRRACFLSVNVYDYLIDRMASVQSEMWASLIKDDFQRQSMETVKFSLLYIVYSKKFNYHDNIVEKEYPCTERGMDIAAWPLIILTFVIIGFIYLAHY